MSDVAVRPPVIEAVASKGAARLPGEPRRIGYLYVLPAFLIYAAFNIVPLVQGFNLSFYNWDGITQGTWVGLANYKDFFTDPIIRSSYLHTLVLIVFYSFIPTAIGLFLAALLSRMRIRGLTVFRVLLFLPTVLTDVVLAVAWTNIYDPQGPLNNFLRAVGLGSLARPWLGDFHWALPAVGVFGAWEEYGFCMILFLAGVMKIPTSLYEAARVDGANAFREFFTVTLPGLRFELTVVLVLTIIDALGTFDEVYVLTNGGPGTATTVPAFQVYSRAFLSGQVGSAAAMGITLMVIVFAVSYGVTKVLEPEAE
ncbi:MAG: sugar ABC transporter permease [Actinomycetota bacterium]|nr:sugar ABC transporter permease [Actinomycetota bacterium]